MLTVDFMNVVMGLLSAGVAVLSLLQGWQILTIRSTQRAIELLGSTDAKLANELTAIRVLVAGSYVTRDEFRESMRDQTVTILGAVAELRNAHKQSEGR